MIFGDELGVRSEDGWQDSSEQDQPGQLAIIGGQLKMEEPRGRGPWPLIAPGKQVKLRQGDEPITRPTVVERAEDIAIEVLNEPPTSTFELVISKDKMQVILKTRFVAGTKYKLKNSEFKQELRVEVEPVGRITPTPIQPVLVFSELEALGINTTVFYDRIIAACTSLEDQEVVIAEGREAKPPVDGKIEVVCELAKRIKNAPTEERINFLDQGAFNSVNAGDVLAYWHPPIPGEPGHDVYGNTIEPRPPKLSRIRAGRGVRLLRDGSIAVAEITGLPSYQKGILRVSPQLVISQDVNLATGNVEFKGDVIVLGSVTESLTVRAGGSVEVLDSVYHAQVSSGGDIVINNKLIGGAVIAGAHQPGLAKARTLLQQALKGLESLRLICCQLKNQPRLSVSDLRLRGDGYLIKLVLETKFSHITKKLTYVHKLLSSLDGRLCDEQCLEVAEETRLHIRCFLGASPLEIKTLEELAKAIAHLQDLTNRLDDLLEGFADITVHYGQNARIEATGDITVTGPLLYDCDAVAGGQITIAGECRSGSYVAGTGIYARSAGSKGLGALSLTVNEDGVIGAHTFYPGVRIRIGSVQTVIEHECHNTKFVVQDGTLVTSAYR